MNYWIDTHAHIYAKEFDQDRDDMLQRCRDQAVNRIFMPNVDHTTIDRMLDLESRSPACIATMGLHPVSVKKDFERELYTVEDWLSKRKFAAIGEIGTDLYWDKTFWDQQCEAFRIQVGWAKKFQLPVIIHCRESLRETIKMVEELQDGNLTGIFHCFSGSVAEALQICKLNFWVGIGGVSTFKKGGLDEVLPAVPLDRIVLETDSPYLAPVPHRGKRNEPSFIPLIAQKVAGVREIDLEQLQRHTTENAIKIFNPDR
jgi:TatD DNase family protein